MVDSTAGAQEVLEGVRGMLERAASQEIELTLPDLWMMVAALRDCESAFSRDA